MMRWPAEKRRDYYVRVQQARGEAARRELQEEAGRQWKMERSKGNCDG